MNRKAIVVLALILGLVLSGFALAAETAGRGTPQELCPVMGGKVAKSVHTDYQEKRIHFCCAGCITDFKKDPEKYMKKLEAQGVTMEKSPEAK